MAFDISLVKRLIIVMMENRSYDHLLGYLSLPEYKDGRPQLAIGLSNDVTWQNSVANPYEGQSFAPFHSKDPYDNMDADPPHERAQIALQMGNPISGQFPMDGFVQNYAGADGAKCLSSDNPPPVMGYFTDAEAPVTHFFAEQFAICDNWFASLPAGTQSNRLMAMSGYSLIDSNCHILPDQDLVYDWLNRNNVRWRVYHQGLPFFTMMPKCIPDILEETHFRDFAHLYGDVENEGPEEFPQVIFIEPRYTDAPHLSGPEHACSDDHAPSAIKGGQEFLLEVYRSVTQAGWLWDECAIIVTYDEHGGFFDHVSPPSITTAAPPDATPAYTEFQSLGVRVPAFVISPFVQPKTVCSEIMDHTSILKLIGEIFSADKKYSDIVDMRPVGSVSAIFNQPGPYAAPIIDTLQEYLARSVSSVGFTPGNQPNSAIQQAFQNGLDMMRNHPDRPPGKFLDLISAFPPGVPNVV